VRKRVVSIIGLSILSRLARTYWEQGQWNNAEKLYVEVMEKNKRLLGDDHPDTLTSMANITGTRAAGMMQSSSRWR